MHALQAVQDINASHDGGKLRAEALIALICELHDDVLLLKSLEAAPGISDERLETEALVTLVSKISNDSLSEFLKLAQAILDSSDFLRAKVFGVLAARLPDDLLPDFLEVVKTIQDDAYRLEVLSIVSGRLGESSTVQIFDIWQQSIHSLAKHKRENVLWAYNASLPTILTLCGKRALAGFFQTAQMVSRWWP
jgi:hypothetical protein